MWDTQSIFLPMPNAGIWIFKLFSFWYKYFQNFQIKFVRNLDLRV